MKMKKQKFLLSFITPAFLGDAQQSGRWRTPPIKANLRQWWRVAYAASTNFCVDIAKMREIEGKIFGNAWLDGAFCKSHVLLRLSSWEEGKQRSWSPLDKDSHPKDRQAESNLYLGYLGYGPLTLPRGERSPKLKANAAIQADESATLSIAYPEEEAPLVEHALWLMDRFGTLGGRSRNGWGSYVLQPQEGAFALSGLIPLRDWRKCLQSDWPQAIGQDDQGALIWQTEPHSDWQSLMKTLATIKINLRTQFRFTTGERSPHPEERHWLAYPVTRHSVAAWGNCRLPNQLRFKVRRSKDQQAVGVIFHMPHLPPASFKPQEETFIRIWKQVHHFLDSSSESKLQRISE
ncbi:MAG TPA: hypothetical protein DEU72_04885 [Desulfomicrobiaceae bacterium]|nr:hypothetical protein [Desulfomicrobiaceae bacterium]